ncbi:hypothetical protein Tco_0121374 [Tanacetum coccineum]
MTPFLTPSMNIRKWVQKLRVMLLHIFVGLIQNLVAPPPNNTYVPFGASPIMCHGIELVKMETSAMIHFLPRIIIVALLLVNESVNVKNPTNPSDFSINSLIGNAASDASLLPPSKEEDECMA